MEAAVKDFGPLVAGRLIRSARPDQRYWRCWRETNTPALLRIVRSQGAGTKRKTYARVELCRFWTQLGHGQALPERPVERLWSGKAGPICGGAENISTRSEVLAARPLRAHVQTAPLKQS